MTDLDRLIRQREYYDALLVQMKLRWSPWVDLFLNASQPPRGELGVACEQWICMHVATVMHGMEDYG